MKGVYIIPHQCGVEDMLGHNICNSGESFNRIWGYTQGKA